MLPRLDKLKAAFDESPDFHQVLGLIYSDILEFNQRAYKIFRRKCWHVWFALDWGLFERHFKSILQRLTSHCDLLDREAAALHFLEMKRVREKRQLEEESYERARTDQLTREVLGWLSADEDRQEEYLHDLSDRRDFGTCDWILAEKQIISWLDDDDKVPLLWKTGIPGAGKSILCSLIVQNAETRHDQSVIYYFCGQRSSDGSVLASLLCTLTVQLLRKNLELAPLIHQAFLQKETGRSWVSIKKILKKVLSTVKTTRIVLDGIDEWNQTAQRDVLKALVELQKTTSSDCKLLVSSRDEPLIRKELIRAEHLIIDGQSAEGLNRYIASKTESLQYDFPSFANTTWEQVTIILQSKAKGMFLWVRLVMNGLQECSSEAEFKSRMDDLPDGLDEAYGRIITRLHGLNKAAKEKALKVLHWVCVARRSVTIDEIADALPLRCGQTELSKETRISNKQKDIVDICAPLLEKTKNGLVEAVHFSAKEYLLHSQSGHFVDIAQAHFDIAFSCVVNLTSALKLVPKHNKSMTDTELERLVCMGNFGLHSYGHEYWAEHVTAFFEADSGSNDKSEELSQALQRFIGVLKAHDSFSYNSITELNLVEAPQGIQQQPALHHLLSAWLNFKSKLNKMGRDFESLEAQEQWQLIQDETYLSLIDRRLRDFTERLLQMDISALPVHIDKYDHSAFVARFRFLCRTHDCHQTFSSIGERDTHEASHDSSFFCNQCDFAGRGFRSKETLKKHTERYHMSAADFEVPESLTTNLGNLSVSDDCKNQPGPRSARLAKSWSSQGRKATQQGFRQILGRVEQSLIGQSGMESEQVIVDEFMTQRFGKSRDTADFQSLASFVTDIKQKIDEQRYDTLSNFKEDVYELVRSSITATSSNLQDEIQSICDAEFEKGVAGFPAFATPTSPRGKSVAEMFPSEPMDGYACPARDSVATVGGHSDAQSSLQPRRKPYWSLAEEKQMPKLLECYGRNLIKIAECLKTKTLPEIDSQLEHQLGSKSEHPQEQPANVQCDVPNVAVETTFNASATGNDLTKTPDPALVPTRDIAMDTTLLSITPAGFDGNGEFRSLNAAGLSSNFLTPPQNATHSESGSEKMNHQLEGDANSTGDWDHDSKSLDRPKRPVRRARPRAKCTSCGKECFDEYAAVKHNARFHIPNRKVWKCQDRSLNESFFSQCRPCSAGKIYTLKHNALKHLRDAHFSNSTPKQTLLRWVEQLEEPNPNYRDASGRQPFYVGKKRLNNPASARPGKRRKVEPRPLVREIPQLENGATKLPPMRITPRKRAISGSPNGDKESDFEDIQSSSESEEDDVELFPDVSFDHLLPQSAPPTPADSQSTLDKFTSSWIRPGQVHRLPHLEQNEKVLCHDQVEALYERLQAHRKDSIDYQDAENDIESLSRTLLKGLRSWRRQKDYLAHTQPSLFSLAGTF